MPPRAPRLSVIIPTLDEAEHVVDLLHDLASLRTQGHEVILVDGGSHDRTREIAQPLADRLITCRPGRAAQMNEGAGKAAGDVLWFLHADTRVPAQAMTGIQSICSEQYDCWGHFDVRLSGTHRLLRIVEWMMNWRSGLTRIATGDQGLFVSRPLFDSIGGFADIPLMEDITLSRSLRRRRRPIRIRSPRLQTSSRRWERNGIVATILLMWRLRLAYALGTPADELARRYP